MVRPITTRLEAARCRLQRCLARQVVVERALRNRSEVHGKLMKKARELQHGLRRLTHRALAMHEDHSRAVGRALRDEISQVLIGINLQLLALKQEARCHTSRLDADLASTRRLVARSARNAHRRAGTP